MGQETSTPTETGGAGAPETDATATGTTAGETEATTESGATPDLQAEVDKWKAIARKNEKRATDNHKELEQLRRDKMSDTERLVAEAADAGKAVGAKEVTARLGGHVLRAEIRAATGGRLAPEQVDTIAAHLDVSAFVTDDGSLDVEKVTALVGALVPASPEPPVPGFPSWARGHGAPAGREPFPSTATRCCGTYRTSSASADRGPGAPRPTGASALWPSPPPPPDPTSRGS